MTGSGRDDLLRPWAAKLLGVSLDAPPEAARIAFLRRLPLEDFVPYPSLALAARCFHVGATGPLHDPQAEAEATRFAEAGLRIDVEEFAARFWTYPPAERRACWESLMTRTALSSGLRTRVHGLAAGLDVSGPELAAGEQPLVAELAHQMCALFVLRLVPRARMWQSLWYKTGYRCHKRQKAARLFRERYPALAALLPDHVAQIASWKPKSPPKPPKSAKSQRQQTVQRPISSQSRTIIWICVVVVGAIVRALDSSSSRPPAYVPLQDDETRLQERRSIFQKDATNAKKEKELEEERKKLHDSVRKLITKPRTPG